ncbi:hypothetical protein STFR1_10482 [Bacillus vallismortis]
MNSEDTNEVLFNMTFPPQITVNIWPERPLQKKCFALIRELSNFFLGINLSSFSMEVNAFLGILTLKIL